LAKGLSSAPGDAAVTDDAEKSPTPDPSTAERPNPQKEAMKIRLVVALVGLAINLAFPAFAQEKETVDPKLRQQIEASDAKFDEAFNKHDAAAIAALYMEDAVLLTPHEVFSGREAIEKYFKSVLEGSSYSDHISKLDQVHTALGIYPWAVGSWTVKSSSHNYTGFRFVVYLPTGDECKISRAVVLY
jgi:ketosteroid isomerase-like protein